MCSGCDPEGSLWGDEAHRAAGIAPRSKGGSAGRGGKQKHAGLPGEKVDPILNKAVSQEGCTVSSGGGGGGLTASTRCGRVCMVKAANATLT